MNVFRNSIATGVLMLSVMLTAVPAQPAYALTPADLEAQIAALMAQVQQLQAQLSGVTGAYSPVCPYTWTRTLTIGSSGPDVKKLQQFLNSDPATQVAAFGTGSKGLETEYYGPLTGAAVAKFQTKYRNEILTPLGLTTPTTFFGNATLAKANALCRTIVVTPPPTPSVPDSEERGDEAVLRHFKVSSGDDTSLHEGQRSVSVMDVSFEVDESDITINRVDVAVEHILGEEDDPWDTFDTITLYVDGDAVASESVDDDRDWNDDSPYRGAYRVRFSNLSLDFEEGEKATFSVGITPVNNIDGAEDGLSWDIFIPDNGIRLIDDSRVYQHIGNESEKVNIDINEKGANDELSIKTSNEDPETSTLFVESDTTSSWMKVFAFTLDTDDSENDIEVRELPVTLTVSTSTVDRFVRDVRLVIDGDVYDDVDITDGMTNEMIFDFDRDELIIDAGDTVTAELEVRFNALEPEYEGVTLFGRADSDAIDAEGVDDLSDSQLSGVATGDEHTLRTFGLNITSEDTSVELLGSNSTVGVFQIEFDVKAHEGDFYIAPYAATTTDSGNGGVQYTVESSSDTHSGTVSAILDSTAKETSGGTFIVREGETETFTVIVTFDPDYVGFYRVGLNTISFSTNPDGTTDAQTHAFTPTASYRTNYSYINN